MQSGVSDLSADKQTNGILVTGSTLSIYPYSYTVNDSSSRQVKTVTVAYGASVSATTNTKWYHLSIPLTPKHICSFVSSGLSVGRPIGRICRKSCLFPKQPSPEAIRVIGQQKWTLRRVARRKQEQQAGRYCMQCFACKFGGREQLCDVSGRCVK